MSGSSSKRKIQIESLGDDNMLEAGKSRKSTDSKTIASPSKSANCDNQSGEGCQPVPDKGVMENKFKSFAQTFAYLKNTDLYKLPPKPPIAVAQPVSKNTHSIIVNSRQRGNPILKYVKNVPWEYGEIIPDYQIGERQCALFLSLRYHNLNPDYIHERLKLLGNKYDLRVILVLVDIKNCKHNLKELGKIGLLAGCTLILTWSAEEAGRYLETYKQYENKPPDILQERVETDYFAKIQDVLTTIKSINKTDAITLISTFGSLQNIVNASKEEIEVCPGFGQQKAQRLYKVFNEPFKRTVINVAPSQQHPSISSEAGQLPSTSKLKRPSENNYLQNCNTTISQPCKVKRNSDKEKVVSTRSSLLSSISEPPISSQCTLDKLEHPRLHSKNEVKTSSKSDGDDNIQPDCSIKEICNKLSTPKGNNSSVDQLVQQLFESPKKFESSSSSSIKRKDLQQSPKSSQTTGKSIPSHKMSKSEAVYKSGLSRNRKEAEKVQMVSSYSLSLGNQSKTDNATVEMIHDPHVGDKKHKSSHHVKSNNLSSSQVVHKSKKIRSPIHNSVNTASKVDKSNVCSSRLAKSGTTTVSSNTTKRVVTDDSASKTSKNIELLKGKIRAGTHTKRLSESATASDHEDIYSTQITNDEFLDLVATEDDEDDDDYII